MAGHRPGLLLMGVASMVFLALLVFLGWCSWLMLKGGASAGEVVAFNLFVLFFAWVFGLIPRGEKQEEDFVCPLSGEECHENCAWYDPEEGLCRMPKGRE